MAGTLPAVLGIDVGTTAVKAMLVGVDGHVLGAAEAQQSVSSPRPGWSEQHPELWWSSTETAVATVLSRAGRLRREVEITAIGLSGQMHSSVFLDADGEVIRPALLWNDGRTTPQCEEIATKVGLPGLRRTVGNQALEGFTAPKILWLRQNEPGSYGRLRTVLLPKDYIRYRLTGELATEPSDAAGTVLFDVKGRRWSREMLSLLDIPRDILPRVVASTDVSGRVTAAAAEALGLSPGVPVIGGGADNAAGAVGSGTVVPGRLQCSIGTSGTLLTPLERPRIDRRMRLHTFCHCVPDRWYLMGTILSAGGSLRWLRDVLAPPGSELAYETLVAEAQEVEVGSDGLFFLPHMVGERTPHNDSSARGVFFGLHPGHSRGHLVRAVMEGVCYALRDSLEIMRSMGNSFSDVRAIGGGARSDLWRSIQADVFNLPVLTMGPEGGPVYGAALIAAVGAGMAGAVEETVQRWLCVEREVEPDPRRVGRYDELYSNYRRLYPALKPRFSETAALMDRLAEEPRSNINDAGGP